jgi:hypothetical protein
LVFINKKNINYVIIIPEKLIVDKSCNDWINRLKIISLEHFDKPLTINKLNNEFTVPASRAINIFFHNSGIFTQENIYQSNNPCNIININQNYLNNNNNFINKIYSIYYSENFIYENNLKLFFKKLLIALFFINIIFLFIYIDLNLCKLKTYIYISDLIKNIKKFIYK